MDFLGRLNLEKIVERQKISPKKDQHPCRHWSESHDSRPLSFPNTGGMDVSDHTLSANSHIPTTTEFRERARRLIYLYIYPNPEQKVNVWPCCPQGICRGLVLDHLCHRLYNASPNDGGSFRHGAFLLEDLLS